MRNRIVFASAVIALIAAAGFGPALVGGTGQDKPAAGSEEAAIRQSLETMVNAFNAGDAKVFAAGFTTDAEYIDDEGQGVRGRAEIEKMFQKYLGSNTGVKLQLTLGGVRLVAPGVALEDGDSIVTIPDKKTESARRYGMVMAKQDGKWLLASLREFPTESDEDTLDPANQLKSLDWAIGEWIDESGEAVVVTTCRWSEDKNYIMRDFTVKVKGNEELKGSQRIGVDPLTGQIKGWSHDSAGGHGTATWCRYGNGWLVKSTGVTSDGDVASATHILEPVSKDKIRWKTMHQVVGDQVEPDTEVILVRRLAPPK